MRPWRDIFSTKAWETIIQGTDSTAHISKMKALRAKFDSSVDTPERKLRQLADQIRVYHAVAKTDFTKLTLRSGYLAQISRGAADYLSKFDVDEAASKARVFEKQVSNPDRTTRFEKVPLERDRFTGHYMSTDPFLQSVDRNVRTLMMRARRKSLYLEKLWVYYGHNSQDPQALLDLLTKPQVKHGNATGLVPGVMVEKLDPYHRPVEVEIQDGKLVDHANAQDDQLGMSAEFGVWFRTIAQHNLPLFLWLEGRPICTSDNKEEVSGTMSVAYPADGGSAAVAAQYKLATVFERGAKLWMQHLQVNGVTQTATTAGYTCAATKGVSDAAAYIWTGREILIAQHQESGFHHSSFNGGNFVRCAGMIKLAAGKITYASNNSGHYQPGKHLLAGFLEYFRKRGLVDPTARVHCAGVKPKYEGTATDFLRDWQTL